MEILIYKNKLKTAEKQRFSAVFVRRNPAIMAGFYIGCAGKIKGIKISE